MYVYTQSRQTLGLLQLLTSPRSEALASGCCCMRSTFVQILLFSRHLKVTGYSFSFDVHILCIRYGTVLANTAVLCVRAGTWRPWWVLLQHFIILRLFFIVKCGIARFLCAMRAFEVWASSSSPRLPLCQISFHSRPPLLHYPMEKIAYLIAQSITHLPSLFDAPGTEACAAEFPSALCGCHNYDLSPLWRHVAQTCIWDP